MRLVGRARLAVAVAVALLPRAAKPRAYRRFLGYDVHPTARIGLSVIDADSVVIGPRVTIGHGNLLVLLGRLSIGEGAALGWLNVARGGEELRIGRYARVMRRNELTSILDPNPVTNPDPRLLIGDGTVITDGHRLDFTDRIELGNRVIVGGRASSLWTHNRQRTAPITIGARTYVGSECRLAPGASLPHLSIVALGSVVSGTIAEPRSLVGGNPAAVVRPLRDDEMPLVDRPTHPELPDGVG